MRFNSSSVRRRSSIKRKLRLNSVYLHKLNQIDWQWYEPPENSAPVRFFHDTSLHGLRYLGQRKRHIFERIFWLISFVAAVICAGILIWHMWDNHNKMPNVIIFGPKEKTVDKIPFPSVTICSVNNIKKSKLEEYERNIKLGHDGGISNETLLQSFANIMDINHICKSGKTFTQKFYDYDIMKDAELVNNIQKYAQYIHLLDASATTTATLRNSSQSCEEMILFCLWLDKVRNCSELWSQIPTDYGFCCVFNMIPLSLLRTYVKDHSDDPERVNDWKEADLYPENLILEDEHGERKYPFRQLYAGRSAGLSFLVDANLEEYHCTNADSDGFVLGLNTPLDFPRMRDNGIAVRTGTEVFVSVRPDITMSAESARKANFEKRHCFFDGERKLNHYTKYTASNCLDECIAKETLEQCRCLRYYMPQSNSTDGEFCHFYHYACRGKIRERFCLPQEYNCTENVKAQMITDGLDKKCGNCWPSCTEIIFHTDVTSLKIRENHIKDLLQHYPNISLNDERAKQASIIHVYYNVDSVFPRLRKEMSTVIDLISNAGGLLGLCMGFSMLSLLEIVYHVTIRLFCNSYRERYKLRKLKTINDENLHNYGSCGERGNSSVWKNYSNSGVPVPARPFYFCSPFESDIQRTLADTKWVQKSTALLSINKL